MSTLEDITNQLASTNIAIANGDSQGKTDVNKTETIDQGVSFADQGLKLDTAEDAQVIVEAIQKCQHLEYLRLEGNTIGVDAAKAIARALETHGELKWAYWKDIFTSRLKTEIPKALQYLGASLVLSGAQLVELDLSDNAFGPVGIEGLTSLLRSPVCFTLETLKLNNNGLGITGGKLLAASLMDCYKISTENGKPLALKVFIGGRNRLENEGARVLSEVFKTVGTFEEIQMPQNGISHLGISALAQAFTHNPSLHTLNLNDNTFTVRGATAMAEALPSLQNLAIVNFGDCLLKTRGAQLIAEALSDGHASLKEFYAAGNEIGLQGGLHLARAMKNKLSLRKFDVSGNQFGEDGCGLIRMELKESGHIDALASLSDDEEPDEEEEEEDYEDDVEEEEEEDEGDEEEASYPEEDEEEVDVEAQKHFVRESNKVTVSDFLDAPTANRLLGLGDNCSDLLVEELKKLKSNAFVDQGMLIIMKVSSLVASKANAAQEAAYKCSCSLYKEYFRNASNISEASNSLLVYLGLIKSEDKQFCITWNLEGCVLGLEQAIKDGSIPIPTCKMLQLFLSRPELKMDAFPSTKHKLMQTLFQY